MKRIKFIFFFLITVFAVGLSPSEMDNYGYLREFTMLDDLGNLRQVQVFIPNTYDYRVPAKVLWYFRGTNDIYITWNIDTTHLYKIAKEEGVVLVAPSLYQKTWSRGEDETDFYLVYDIIQELQTLKDNQDRLLNLDLHNMSAAGFSGGGGFIYHIAGKYLILFNDHIFKKYIAHAKALLIDFNAAGNIVGGNEFDIQAFNDMKTAFQYLENKPPFLLSVGTNDFNGVDLIARTGDDLSRLGLDVSLVTVPDMGHRFQVDFTPEFKQDLEDFLYPIHITRPKQDTLWCFNPWEPKEFEINWTSARPIDQLLHIDLYPLEGRYVDLADEVENTGTYTVNSNALPLRSGKYYLKMRSADNIEVIYSPPFDIEVIPIDINLLASRHEERAWIVRRSYARLDLSVLKLKWVEVLKFVVYRKKAADTYQVIGEIPGSELQDGDYIYIDKYLEKDVTYTYKVEALDLTGAVLTVSEEKII